MAINRGVLGSQTGSMGGITASNWKGRNVYKQKVPATNSSNSPAQAMQRRKFAALVQYMAALGPALRIGYRVAAATTTEQNVFVSRNFQWVTDNGTFSTVDNSQIEVSSGIVRGVEGLNVAWNVATGIATVTYDDNSNGADALPSDILCIAVGGINGSPTFLYTGPATRLTGTSGPISVGIPGPDAVYGMYVFFKRASSTATSPSTFADL